MEKMFTILCVLHLIGSVIGFSEPYPRIGQQAGEHGFEPRERVPEGKGVADPDPMLEGDIHLTKQDVRIDSKTQRRKRAATSIPHKLWPGAIIPYVIGEGITSNLRRDIKLAMLEWEKHTCISFELAKPRSGLQVEDYIMFVPNKPGGCGCCSHVGKIGGAQHVVLDAEGCGYGSILHELGHVIGFYHEQSRVDRDDYVQIVKSNIKPDEWKVNFAKKKSTEVDSLGQGYDYSSIMHYSKKAFSINGKDTVVPLRTGWFWNKVNIGQGKALSKGDIIQTKLLYKCTIPVGCKTSKLGTEYNGGLARTSGKTCHGLARTTSVKTCQRWDSQNPHSHRYNNLGSFFRRYFPDKTLADAANFCRNPDNDVRGPWCYTTDPKLRWNYCDVPYCPCVPKYLGCWRDDSERVMKIATLQIINTQSTSSCVDRCRKLHYEFAGTEVGTECYCGDDYTRRGPSDNCKHRCTGASGEICGGDWALSVYRTGVKKSV